MTLHFDSYIKKIRLDVNIQMSQNILTGQMKCLFIDFKYKRLQHLNMGQYDLLIRNKKNWQSAFSLGGGPGPLVVVIYEWEETL